MKAPTWYLTDSAVNCYVYLQRWPDDNAAMVRAEAELLRLMPRARFRERDQYGRELWRSPKQTGGGLRWVIDPRPRANATDKRPRVIWVGHGRPPATTWCGAATAKPFGELVAKMSPDAQQRVRTRTEHLRAEDVAALVKAAREYQEVVPAPYDDRGNAVARALTEALRRFGGLL